MRFILLVPSLDKGGSERFLSNLSLMLKDKHQVKVAVFDNDIKYPVGGELVDLKAPTKKTVVARAFTVIERCFKLRKLVKSYKPDVILSVMTPANRINTLCNFKGVKQFVSCRGFAELEREPEVFLNSAAKTDGVIFNSKEAKDYFCRKLGGPANKAFYNYNIIDFERISQGISQPINHPELEEFMENHRCVVNLGRLSKVKCQPALIKAFELVCENVPDAGLVIVGGSGEYVEEVYKAAEASPCKDRIFMAGNKDNPYNVLSKCKVYALSSKAEGFPNALVEAMACDLAIVSADCMTGPGEILRKEFTSEKATDVEIADYGVLTPMIEGNEEIYAKALELILTDEALRDRLKKEAVNRAKDFAPEKALEDFLEIVSE